MTPDICGRCEFTADLNGDLYHTTTLYSLALVPAWHGRAHFLLGILNSKVLWFFMRSTGTPLRGNFYRFKTDYLKPFPIPDSDPEREQLVENLVKSIMTTRALVKHHEAVIRQLTARDPSLKVGESEFRLASAFFEHLIDAIVYELCFPEEFSDPERCVSTLLLSPNLDFTDKPTGAVLNAIGAHTVLDDLVGSVDAIVIAIRLFRAIYEPTHPIRRAIHMLDTIEPVRVIEEASR